MSRKRCADRNQRTRALSQATTALFNQRHHPRLIRDWSAENDVAASMGELDNSRFVLGKHQLEFETHVSKIAQGIMVMIPSVFKKKINFLEETQHKNKCPMVTSRQILLQVFLFFNCNKTQGHTMNLSDLLDVELHNDNLKIFNQAWEEPLLALGTDLDEGVLENM